MDEAKWAWLCLHRAFADYPRLFRVVRERFPSPADALKAPPAELRSLGLDEERIERLTSPRRQAEAHKEFDRLQKKGYSLVTFEDVEYPVGLREIFDPPAVLICWGGADGLQGPAVAIVGTRNPSPYGRAFAERLAEDLASGGIVVVSGLALGIDAYAHWGALKGGRTVAVLGSGLENIYPRHNRKLAAKIAASGAVVSEFPLDAEPFAGHFPQRNRIISGLSLAVVVVEAAEQSGSLITARLALEQNREVMAVPGNVTSELSRGTNRLIKEGAKLVESWVDVAEDLPSPLREILLARKQGGTPPLPLLTDEEAALYGMLRPDEVVHIDLLHEKSGRPVTELATLLLNLEIKGLIVQRPGTYYQRRM